MNTVGVGKFGEDIACRYLESNGYTIIKRNYRASGGEIDIVAKKGTHLAFVEVKTRKNQKFGSASEAVNYHKQQKIIHTARAFLMRYTAYEDISFDVCEVYTENRYINYIEAAFEQQ